MLGEFYLEHVAWHSGSAMFLCQSQVNREYWSLRQAIRAMAKANWTEEEEARWPF